MFHIKHLETFISGYQNNLNKIELLKKENETLKESIIQLSKQLQNYQNEERILQTNFTDSLEQLN